jgi:large subunit ribosomal protein L3
MTDAKGILGTKLGMTQIFDDTLAIPVTVISAGPCVVTQVKTQATDGYDAVQIAYGERPARAVGKPMKGHLEGSGVSSARHLVEMRTDGTPELAVGARLTADLFSAGELVDVIGVSKGKGFTGVMKRHGFHGLRASHGVKGKHRSPGAIGACATPSRVFKGMPMAGQHGNARVTVLNMQVVRVDTERHLVLVKGAVPGSAGSLVMVRSAVKAPAGEVA